MAVILCVLYPDPEAGYPPAYPRDEIPVVTRYANGQTAPTPKGPLGFKPGALVGCVSGELGLRPYLEKLGHELVVTSEQGRSQLGIREAPVGRRSGHLAAVLACISDERASRQGQEAEACVDGGHWFRSRGPGSGCAGAHHGRGGHRLKQYQRPRVCVRSVGAGERAGGSKAVGPQPFV